MLTYTPEAEARRAEVRQWLKDNLPPRWFEEGYEMSPEERKKFNETWAEKLFDGGWICATWPKEYGQVAHIQPPSNNFSAQVSLNFLRSSGDIS